jgi:hypothetical protein
MSTVTRLHHALPLGPEVVRAVNELDAGKPSTPPRLPACRRASSWHCSMGRRTARRQGWYALPPRSETSL